MGTTTALDRKSSRMDLRMTDDQKRQIDEAAHINGMSVSQWSISRLMESARRDIEGQYVVRMARQSFDSFTRILDEEVDPVFAEFAGGATRWDD